MTAGLVIVGGGQAAASAAAKIREIDSDIPVTMICEENVLPYQRPPLSKKYLQGEMPIDRLILRPQDWFDDTSVTLKLGIRAENIDREQKLVTLSNGETCQYDKLLIATGSTPRQLSSEIGANLSGVHYLRSSLHSDVIRPSLEAGRKLAIIGGGYIGLEVAAVAAQAGMDVTVIEMADRILQRVAALQTSDFYRELHTKHGVKILEGVGLSNMTGIDGHVSSVTLTNGQEIEADLLLVGIGVVPVTQLAESCGLDVENGILVDEMCRSSDPEIYSAGDCANFEFQGQRIRLESVPNAIHQAEIAAENMLGAEHKYVATPWFWSDQFDVKLQIAGWNVGYTNTIVRSGNRDGAQSVWYYRNDRLVAVDAMNDAPSFMMARRIIEAGKSVPAEIAADSGSNLKEWI